MEVLFTLLCSIDRINAMTNMAQRQHPHQDHVHLHIQDLRDLQQHNNIDLLEMGQSFENFVPAEEQDSSNFVQQRQISRDLSDPTQPPSSED